MTFGLLLLSLIANEDIASQDPEWTIGVVADRVVARHEGLRELFVDLFITTSEGDATQTDRIAVAFAARRCFLDFMHLTGPGDPPWRDNVRFQVWLTSEQTKVFMPFKRELSRPMEGSWRNYWVSPYATAIGWHPKAKVFEEPDEDLFYLDQLFNAARRSELLLGDETEIVDTYECVKVETRTKADQLWLAPDLGFALVKRVTIHGEGGRFKRIYRCGDFKEAAEGLWLPWKVRTDSFEIVEGQEKALRSVLLDIQKLGVNDAVPDSIFEFTPPSGMITVDEKNRPIAFEPGGEDLLDFWSAVCAMAFPSRPQNRVFSWQVVFSTISGVFVLFAATLILLRIRRQ